jgi:hypothetical protein
VYRFCNNLRNSNHHENDIILIIIRISNKNVPGKRVFSGDKNVDLFF